MIRVMMGFDGFKIKYYFCKMKLFPFSKNLFWDCDIADIELQKNKRYVIERVLTRAQRSDFDTLVSLYSREEIIASAKKSRELDPKTAHFCSWYFNIPITELHVASFFR